MKKNTLLMIIIIVMLISATLFVACAKSDEPISGVITKECAVRDFQTLRKVFPKKLLLPSDCTNESVYVINDENITLKNDIEHQIALELKVNSLVGGGWSKRFTEYTIEVRFQPGNEWVLSDELAEKVIEGEINGYQVYQMKENNQIFIIDKDADLFYTVICTDTANFTNEQRDNKVREYINLMMN